MRTGAAGIASLIKAPINAVIKAWNDLHLKIPGFSIDTHIPGVGKIGWKGYDIKTPNIPTLAAGGIVTSPTYALVGEAGPEAVIPLRSGASSGFGGGGSGAPVYQLVINAPVYGPGGERALFERFQQGAWQFSRSNPTTGILPA
jgi:hypothetical protein